MEQLTQGYTQAITIAARYGFHTQSALDALQAMRSFLVTVPMIGTFNTGKSSLLNALLGSRLLPTGIVASTAVPTELTYGKNGVTVRRDGRDSQTGLGELRGNLDLQGVTLLSVAYEHPFLQRISSLKLVDMPGLDSGAPGREQLMRAYLPQSLAYLLVFSADEPVIKESVALFLSELCLMNVPVFAVLNKCDKVAPEELAQAQQFLKQQLCQMFHLQDFALCCVSAHQPEGIKPLLELLLTLQTRADTLAVQDFSHRLALYCRELRQYLLLRSSFEALTVSELDSRIMRLKKQSAALLQAMEDANARFFAQVETGKRELHRLLGAALEGVALPIEAMLSTGQNPHDYVGSMLRSTLAAGVLNIFEPAAGSYLRQAVSLLERRSIAGATSGVVERFRREANQRCTQKTATPAVETLLACLPDTEVLFERLFTGGKFLSEKQRDILSVQITEELLPQLRAAFQPCIDEGLLQSANAVCGLTQAAVSEETYIHQQALLDIQAIKQSDDTLHREDRQRVYDDLAAVNALLEGLDEPVEVLQ